MTRHFDTEDGTEDAAGEQVSGWNGSQALFVPEHRQPLAPISPAVRLKLQALRDEASRRHGAQRTAGLCQCRACLDEVTICNACEHPQACRDAGGCKYRFPQS